MEKITLDTAIKLGAGRYRQGPDILEQCGEEIARFGKKIYIVAGPRAFDAVKDRLLPGMEQAGLTWQAELYTGMCSYEAAREYADRCLTAGCDEVVGIGGGKIMDFSKAVAEYAGLGTVNIPTSISTCAPFTCMSVMYTPAGGKLDCWRYTHELDAVLMDTEIIAHCPARYTAAGILDAMAKRIEIQNGKPVMTLTETKVDLFSAFRMAQYAYEVLEQYGPQAVADNRRGLLTKAIEDVSYINVAVTGIIANMTQSFAQSAIAHSFYDCVRTHFVQEAAASLHGEIVAVGLFAQLHYNRLDTELETLRTFMRNMNMPLTLSELGITPTSENLQVIENYLIDSPYVAPGPESLALLHESLNYIL